MSKDTLLKYVSSEKGKEHAAKALKLVDKFQKRFPFRTNPDLISKLTPQDLYDLDNPVKDYFFYWIQYKLNDYGHINVGSDLPYRNACEHIETFKLLLRNVVDDTKSLAQKIDAPWQQIKGFGGDRNLAKKIVCCFHPNEFLNAFKTEDLEYFANKLGLNPDQSSFNKYSTNYDSLSLGRKYELLTDDLLRLKNSHDETQGITNTYFGHCLYRTYSEVKDVIQRASAKSTAPKIAVPLSKIGLLFEPRTHEELLYLFGVMHRDIGFPYVVLVRTGFPDIIALDENREVKKVELEVKASHFDHEPSGCDYVVCWENDKAVTPEQWPKIIALKEFL